MQLAVTVLFSALSMTNLAFFAFQVNNMWAFYVSLAVAMIVQIYMFCCNGGRTFPGNFVCVGIFTLAESYMVSFICSITGKESGNGIVLLAAVYTLGTDIVTQSLWWLAPFTQPIRIQTSLLHTESSSY